MVSNIDDILKNDVFKNLEPCQINSLKELSDKITGKSVSEAMPALMAFMNTLPKQNPLPKEERDAMAKALIDAFPESEQAKFISILKFAGIKI